jgi:hypothetical protein
LNLICHQEQRRNRNKGGDRGWKGAHDGGEHVSWGRDLKKYKEKSSKGRNKCRREIEDRK